MSANSCLLLYVSPDKVSKVFPTPRLMTAGIGSG